jgi:hypothetical protein
LGIGVFAIAVSLALFWRPGGRDVMAAGQCRNYYRLALTAAESTAVDSHRPLLGRADAPASVSCGVLRARGLTD